MKREIRPVAKRHAVKIQPSFRLRLQISLLEPNEDADCERRDALPRLLSFTSSRRRYPGIFNRVFTHPNHEFVSCDNQKKELIKTNIFDVQVANIPLGKFHSFWDEYLDLFSW